MKSISCIMCAALVIGVALNTLAQEQSTAATPTAALETRVVKDSSGCPTAIDLWLVSTTDTIQGFEAVLQWDRPEHPLFVRGVSPNKKGTGTDTLMMQLKPTDPRTQIPIDRSGSLIARWEFTEARSTDGHFVKILGVAKLLGQDDPSPVLPGASGSLMRIPLSPTPMSTYEADTGLATLYFDPASTRLSTPQGVLFEGLTLRSSAIDVAACRGPRKTGK
jgi:hypothetical protein